MKPSSIVEGPASRFLYTTASREPAIFRRYLISNLRLIFISHPFFNHLIPQETHLLSGQYPATERFGGFFTTSHISPKSLLLSEVTSC